VFGRRGVVEAEQKEYRTIVESGPVESSELAAAEMTRKKLD
jgi:hypothetical protein